ncbi:MAG TPA: aminodeoxychorismate synthase component I [Gemmatimonadales bacterium]|nr:aminodeoxychorismate synthase component I [Gemmatimonadales bacterium]
MTIVVPLTPAPDPFGTCVRCSALPYLLFLDSSAQGTLGRYSFLTADPVALARTPDEGRAMLRRYEAKPLDGLPPFQGGIGGYLTYDWGAELERVQRPAPDQATPRVADVLLALYDWVIAWDHLEEKAWLISTGIDAGGRGESAQRAAARATWVRERLAAPGAPAIRDHAPSVTSEPQSNFSRAEYEAAVSRIREYIAAGDVYQANLAQRFQAPFTGSALALYRRLRARNPAPFGAYLEFSGAAIASISPERFLRFDPATRVVEARPIKGTRPRGNGAEKDRVLARELLASEKDRAENVMIVDLLRNDLGKVCRPGSVLVPKLFALESHPTVHHLVSTVTGVLADGKDGFDLLRAAFPGGSVTGAPKIRAMEIIAELERAPRGVYCGAIGYVSRTGAMDFNIPIRTIVVRDGRASFHAGAGIVWDSDPAAEYQETLAKARTMIEALTSPRRTPRTHGRVYPQA